MRRAMITLVTGIFLFFDYVYGVKSKGDDIIIIGAGGSGGGSPVIVDSGGGGKLGKKGSSTIIILPAQKSSHSNHGHLSDVSYHPPPPSHYYGDTMYGSASYHSRYPPQMPYYTGNPMSRYHYPDPHTHMSIKANVSTKGPRAKRKKRKSRQKSGQDHTTNRPSLAQSGSFNMMSMRPSMNSMNMMYNDNGNQGGSNGYGSNSMNNGANNNGGYGGNMIDMSKMPQIVIKVPAPIINVPPAIVNVSAPIVNVPPAQITVPEIRVPETVVNVPTPVVNVPTPMVNVDVPNIMVPPAVVKVPKKLILRKEVKVRQGMMTNGRGNGGYGGDMADSEKIDFEEAEYQSSSNKNDDQTFSFQNNDSYDDNDFEVNQPIMKQTPRIQIPRTKKKRRPQHNSSNQPPRSNSAPLQASFQFQANGVQYDSKQSDGVRHPQYNQQYQHPDYQPVRLKQPQGQMLRLTIPVPVLDSSSFRNQKQNQRQQQSVNDFKTNDMISQLINPTAPTLPNPQAYYRPPPYQRFDFDTNVNYNSQDDNNNNNNYPLTDRQVLDLIHSKPQSSLGDNNLHVLSDDSREPNIIFEKTEPPMSPATYFEDQFRDASTGLGQTMTETMTETPEPTEESPKAFYRDSRDGIIFEELPKDKKSNKQDMMMYQDQTNAPVYAAPEEDNETDLESTTTKYDEDGEYYNDSNSGDHQKRIIEKRSSNNNGRRRVSECLEKQE